MFRAGFSSRVITPRVGQEIPGLFSRRVSTGVHDDLFVRAAVLDDGTECVALVQVDAIAAPERLVRRARRGAARRCGIRGANCMIAATHTHSGGPVADVFLSEPDEMYIDLVADQAAEAIAEAYGTRGPALLGTERADAPGLAFNRRFKMKDGSQQTHPGKLHPDITEPAGPANPGVTVAGLCDPADWRPLGCVVHFACHGTHMNGVKYSADYFKWVVDTLQGTYGPEFGVVCLNGACGDVTQVDNQNGRPLEIGPFWAERTGRGVAGAALTALARMDWRKGATVAADAVKVGAQVRASTTAERKAARALLKRTKVTAGDVETVYARELLEVDKMRRQRPARRLEVMGVRLGNALFWGVPAEFFQAFAAEVGAESPFKHTCCVELANGYNGYVCTPESFNGGGYEIRTARSSFLEPGAGARISRTAKRLAVKMYAVGKVRRRECGGNLVWPKFEDNEVLDGIRQITEGSE